MRPPVSVVVPTYNRAYTLGRALNSILVQTDDRDDVIVVDDGSVDDTAAVVAGFGDAVRYIRQPNLGPGAARNRGIAAARHELITFLDSDDEWLAGKLDMQCALMVARPDLVMSFADMRMLFADGQLIDSAIGRWQGGARPWEEEMDGPVMLSDLLDWSGGRHEMKVYIGDLYGDLLERCWIHCNAAIFRRTLAGSALHFAEDFSIYEDWECFAKTAKIGPFAFVECCVATQIVHSQGRLTECDDLARAIARVAMLEQVWGTDIDFLRSHSGDYQRVIDKQRTRKAQGLIIAGRRVEARAELLRTQGFP
ncbi:MAG: glycosyltransferase family A protein, partial [Verrucomicrobiales bacterium]